MGDNMAISGHWSWLVLATQLTAGLGCDSTSSAQRTPRTPIQMTDFGSVEGKWEGILRRLHPPSRQEDWITLIIAPNGKYRFSSVRSIGVFRGEGTLVLNHGGAADHSRRPFVDMDLYEAGAQRMLGFTTRWDNGEEYAAHLTQK